MHFNDESFDKLFSIVLTGGIGLNEKIWEELLQFIEGDLLIVKSAGFNQAKLVLKKMELCLK